MIIDLKDFFIIEESKVRYLAEEHEQSMKFENMKTLSIVQTWEQQFLGSYHVLRSKMLLWTVLSILSKPRCDTCDVQSCKI